eukprot:Lankesteria_metandrocarpae@DN1861_c0_g1_i1.p1
MVLQSVVAPVTESTLSALYGLVAHALWSAVISISSSRGSSYPTAPLGGGNLSPLRSSYAVLQDYSATQIVMAVTTLFILSTITFVHNTGFKEFFKRYKYVTNDEDDGQDIQHDPERNPAVLPWCEHSFPLAVFVVLPCLVLPLWVLNSAGSGAEKNETLDFLLFGWASMMCITHFLRALRCIDSTVPDSLKYIPANTSMSLPKVDILEGVQEVTQLVFATALLARLVYFYHSDSYLALLQNNKCLSTITLPFNMGGMTVSLIPTFTRIAVMGHLLVLFIGMSKVLYRFSTIIRPVMATFFIVAHGLAVYGLYMAVTHRPSELQYPAGRGRLALDVFILYFLGAMGITAGSHRLWAHRSYKANFPYRCLMMVCNSIAQQGTVYDWCRDHRLHHAFSEEDADPHNSTRGFFFAHMGWLLLKRAPAVVRERKNVDVSDLLEDPLVVTQMKLEPYWNLFWCFLAPSLYAHHVYHDFALGFFTLGLLRWVLTLHCTWCVNSVAHLWGVRPYRENIGPVESPITAILACGEGWHNWHHTYAFDYAASELGAFRQFNPTKLIIDTFALLGWVWDRKRATTLWQNTVKKRAARARATLEAYAAATTLPESPVAVHAVSTAADERSTGLMTAAAARRFASPLAKIIPAACHRISTLHSLMYLFQDLFAVSAVAVVSALLWLAVSRQRASLPADAALWSVVGWAALETFVLAFYSLAQGTTMMALWVTSYECAGGRFSRYSVVNTVMGFLLSTLLLIPYNRRTEPDCRSTARKGKRIASHLSRALYEDFFALFDLDRWSIGSMPCCGFITALSSVLVLGLFIRMSGISGVLAWYLGAWLVMNCWLFLYQRLLLVKVNTRAAQVISGNNPSLQHRVTGGAGDNTTGTDIDNSESTEAEMLCFDPDTLAYIEDTTDVPLPQSTVEFFTRQWLMSAMEVFDTTTLGGAARSTTASGGGGGVVNVRLAVRVLVFLFGSMHRHLTQINVLQALDLSVPHYHVHDAMQEVEKYVSELRKVVMSAATKCDVPTGLHGVVDMCAN